MSAPGCFSPLSNRPLFSYSNSLPQAPTLALSLLSFATSPPLFSPLTAHGRQSSSWVPRVVELGAAQLASVDLQLRGDFLIRERLHAKPA